MPDIFISYSRKDTQFVRSLYDALASENRDVWVDWEDIPPASKWLDDIFAAIEGADAFVFVISPDSLRSEVCAKELAHAGSNNKRLVPLLLRLPGDIPVPDPLASLNWLYFRPEDDFTLGVQQLLHAVDTDLVWVRMHTRLLVRGNEWENAGRDPSFLLRGADLEAAEQWLAQAVAQKAPPPAPVHTEYLRASQKAQAEEIERLRQLYLNALSRQLAAQAELLRRHQPDLLERSALLAAESLLRVPNSEADRTLREAIALLPYPLAEIRHPAEVQQVVFSPDGRLLATAGDDGAAVLWSLAQGGILHRLEHATPVSRIAFSPTAPLLAASAGGKIHLWSTVDGTELPGYEHGDLARALAFSPDGRLLASGGDGGTVLLQELSVGLEAGDILASSGDGARLQAGAPVWRLAFSPDGRFLAAGCQDSIARVWEVAGRKEIARLQHDTERPVFLLQLGSHDAGIGALAFSPDSRLVASGGNDGRLKVWEAATGEPVAEMTHAREVHAAAFSPDGRYLASGSMDRTARLWDPLRGQEIRRFSHAEIVNAVKFSADGARLATASGDRTARLWEVETGRELSRMTHPGFVVDVDLTQDGNLAASADWSGAAWLWQPGRPADIVQLLHESQVKNVCISPDKNWIATVAEEYGVYLWNASAAWEVKGLPHDSFVGPVLFSPGSERLVTTGWEGHAKVWDTAGQELLRLPHPERIWDAALSQDGELLVTACYRQAQAWLWRLSDGELLAELPHRGQVRSVAISPDGCLVAAGGDDSYARVWQVPRGNIRGNIRGKIRDKMRGSLLAEVGHAAPVFAVALSPSGDLLATGSDDGSAVIWEAKTGRPVHRLPHGVNVSDLAFSPDGSLLATRVFDLDKEKQNHATLWEVSTGRELYRLRHEDTIHHLEFSSDGRFLATASQDRTARVWETAGGREVARILHDDIVYTAAFSQDGEWLATAGGEGLARISPLQPEALIAAACARLTRNLTLAEWQQYLPGEPYHKTCPDLPGPED